MSISVARMGTLEKLAQESSMSISTGSSYAGGGGGKGDQFPAGLRVLVVDDDPTCLKILEKMLRRCLYQVTTCCRATVALSLLRERKGGFDLVISDVYMPDMDGFKLLEHVGLEMDLPVIMMSADGGTSAVMKGIKHGACDYLIKPVRLEELKNIWQHVIRKKRNESKDFDHSGSVEDNERHRKGSDDVEYASSVNEGTDGNWKQPKKRKEAKEDEDDGEPDNEDPSASKKPRVVWSVELHQQFVSAVNQLGIDKAVPKRILELMNVQGLTRENVASHLQKYRLYLKRLSGVAQQQSGMNNSFGGSTESNVGSIGSLGRLDLQALAASARVSPQALVALQAEFLGRANATNGLGMPGVDPALLLQAALQGVNYNPMNRVRFGQPLMNSQGSLLQELPTGLEMKQFAQLQQRFPSFANVGSSIDDALGYSMLQQQLGTNGALGSVDQVNGINNNGSLNAQNNAMMLQLIQQQQQQQQVNEQQQQMETSATQQQQPGRQLQGAQLQNGEVLNLTSSSLLGSQAPLNDIRGRVNPLSPMGNSSVNLGNGIIGASTPGQLNRMAAPAYNLIASESNTSVGIGRTATVDYKNQNVSILQGSNYSVPNTVCVSAPLTSIGTEAALNIPGLKRFGGMSDVISPPMLSDSGINFGTSSGLGQSGRQGWQVQNLSTNQDLGQTASAVQSSSHIQSSFGTQGLNAPGVQDQGQVRSFGFVGKGAVLPSRLASDSGFLRTVCNAQSQRDPFTADSGLRLKTECLPDFVVNPKNESGLLSGQFSPDELMNFVLKQQQEGIALTEGEFSLDGYQLDNIHVK